MTATLNVRPARTQPRTRTGFFSRENERVGYLFVAPASAHLLLFMVFPIGFSIYLSLHNWNSPDVLDAPFVGLANYLRLTKDSAFWHAMTNTLWYVVLSVPLGMAVSLLMAVVVNRKMPAINFFRGVFFLPVITSWVAISVVWITLLSPNSGVVNYLLTLVGLPGQHWLDDPRTAMMALVVITVWKGAGFQMVIWLAGLQAVPADLLDAAAVDGANPWKTFWNVTLPLLFPTTFFLVITGVIGGFQVFTPMYVITKGGPLGSTDVAVYHIYVRAFREFDMGYASAEAWVLFAVIFVATLLQLWVGRRTGQNALAGED